MLGDARNRNFAPAEIIPRETKREHEGLNRR